MGHFSPATLRRAVGHDNFYSIVAELDPTNAAGWFEMIEVQRTFGEGESDYDQETRTYSESMRHTLHWSMVFIFENPATLRQAQSSDGGLYGYFIRLHPTAFKANGACELNPMGMAEVMFNTRGSMVNAQNTVWLSQGLASRYEVAVRGAAETRRLRAARGLPVTVDGYREPRRMTSLQRRMARHGRARALRNAGLTR